MDKHQMDDQSSKSEASKRAAAKPHTAHRILRTAVLGAALLLLSNSAADGATIMYDGVCPGGGLALTPALYAQGYNAFKNAVCIPDYAFCATGGLCPDNSPGLTYQGDVTLISMGQLVYVGTEAFSGFRGTLTMNGSFPKWKAIGTEAFASFQKNASSIVLDGASSSLEMMGYGVFDHFRGRLSAVGTFANLQGCYALNVDQPLKILKPAAWLVLTPDLYAQGSNAYKDVDCIPDFAFCDDPPSNGCPEGDAAFRGDAILLENLEKLKFVGNNAFSSFKGTMTMRGSFPQLKEICAYAFNYCGNAGSSIALDGAAVSALEAVRHEAFGHFAGKVAISGTFPKWKVIAKFAFVSAGTADSSVTLDGGAATMLETLGASAFQDFQGKLVMQGSFPKLRMIHENVFNSAGTADSSVTLGGADVDALEGVGIGAFLSFKGTLTIHGSFPEWREIGFWAFKNVAGTGSVVAIQCRGATWSVGFGVFDGFKGLHNDDGESRACADTTVSTFTTTPATTKRTCNGNGDPPSCDIMKVEYQDKCTEAQSYIGKLVRAKCPVLCNTCTLTTPVPATFTARSETTFTTTTPPPPPTTPTTAASTTNVFTTTTATTTSTTTLNPSPNVDTRVMHVYVYSTIGGAILLFVVLHATCICLRKQKRNGVRSRLRSNINAGASTGDGCCDDDVTDDEQLLGWQHHLFGGENISNGNNSDAGIELDVGSRRNVKDLGGENESAASRDVDDPLLDHDGGSRSITAAGGEREHDGNNINDDDDDDCIDCNTAEVAL